MTKKLLTIRKEKWVNQFKPDNLKSSVLSYNAAIQSRYEKSLLSLINQMTKETEEEIKKLFQSETAKVYFAEDASVSAQAKILAKKLSQSFEKLFNFEAQKTAEAMVNDTDKYSQQSVKNSLKEISGGLNIKTDFITGELKEIFSASVNENVSLIRTIPQKYLSSVESAVMRSITTGNGLADLIPFLQKQKSITKRHARIIALDQTRKAYVHLNKARYEKMGIKKFQWIHSGGGHHPRKLHQQMSGNIYSFDNPPIIDEKTGQRGLPADAINCKCSMKIIIDFGQEG